MSIAKTSEIMASSDKSFEDAVRNGIKRFSKTVDKVEGAWVKEQKVTVKDGEVDEYRVPTYRVELATPPRPHAGGESVEAQVEVNYFTGKPATDAEVEYGVAFGKLRGTRATATGRIADTGAE